MKSLFEPRVRTYIYAVSLAVLALLTGYGVVDLARTGDWTLLIVAILGLPAAGTGTAYRPTKDDPAD